MSGLDFQVPKARFTVSGKVTRDGQPQGGVRIGGVLTAADGTYSVTAEEGSSLTLSPAFLDYASSPAQIVLSALQENKTGQDFELGKVTSTLALSPLKIDFDAVTEGYSPVSAITVKVENTAGETCSGLTVSLPAGSSFEVSALSGGTLAVGESATFTVKPKDGLSKGSYSSTVTVKSGVLSLTVPVSFQVNAATAEPDRPAPPSGGGGSGGGSSGGGSHREEKEPTPAKPAQPEAKPSGTHTPYLQGYHDGLFHPDDPMTRAQCAAMLARLLEDFDPEAKVPAAPFPDTDPDQWYIPYVAFVRQKRVVGGYQDGTFHPDEPMTRAEFATVVRNILKLENPESASFSDISGHWARNAIGQLVQAGILNGYPDGTFRPDDPISRAEAAKVLNRAYHRAMEEGDRPTGEAPSYPDLPESHWAYYDIWEASVEHSISSFHGND